MCDNNSRRNAVVYKNVINRRYTKKGVCGNNVYINGVCSVYCGAVGEGSHVCCDKPK